MNTDTLLEKKNYYFYEKIKTRPMQVSRGRFLDVFINPKYSYLIKTRFEEKTRKNVLVYSPLEWYIKFETLDDILSKTCLPTDIVNIIDEFL
jgi:predicted helicase